MPYVYAFNTQNLMPPTLTLKEQQQQKSKRIFPSLVDTILSALSDLSFISDSEVVSDFT